MNEIRIKNRKIGFAYKPFIIAEIGINHEGNINKALKMIDDAHKAGAECVKTQIHFLEDEMTHAAKDVIPGHTRESIWSIMKRCHLTEKEHVRIKKAVENRGMIYLATPFSRKAVDFLRKISVSAFKIGSGECNNYPLVDYIAKLREPIILSTGMNDIKNIAPSVKILRRYGAGYALLHCTSLYPTSYEDVRLGAIKELQNNFKDAVIGLSDHSLGIYTSLGAIALGASIIEKHFTSKKSWRGPDILISVTPLELKSLIEGSDAVHASLGGRKRILDKEIPTIKFAYASVVSIKNVKKGELFTKKNIWVKRPGTGEIKAADFSRLLGKSAKRDIIKNSQISWRDVT